MQAAEPVTLAQMLDDLDRRGFTEQSHALRGTRLRRDAPPRFAADEVVVSEFHRFEGVSDPTTCRSCTRSRPATVCAAP